MLGAATSGVTMMRGIGGSLGTAVFGTIFATRLADQLHGALHGPLAAQARHGVRLTGAQVARLPPPQRAIYQHAYVHALSPVFALAAGVSALGLVLSLFLQDRTLRAAPATSTGLEDSMAAPRAADSLAEIERSLTRVTTPEERTRFRERVAERAGLTLSPGATWALVRIHEHGVAQARALAAQDGVPKARVEEVVAELTDRGLLAAADGEHSSPSAVHGDHRKHALPSALHSDHGEHTALSGDHGELPRVTAAGRDYTERLIGARCDLLAEALADDEVQRRPEVLGLLRRLAGELCGEPPTHPPGDRVAVPAGRG